LPAGLTLFAGNDSSFNGKPKATSREEKPSPSEADGTEAGSNTIADNTQRGVWINASAGAGNSVRHNSIHGNGSLGIALATVGVLPNDAGDPDTGANNRQNTPEIQSVVENGTDMLDVTFLVDSATTHAAYDLTVEFFIADGRGKFRRRRRGSRRRGICGIRTSVGRRAE
jgi:hypothetical protein